MAETRRKFDRDFKEGAVRLVRETGRPIAQVAKGLSINDGCCGRSRPGQHRHATTPGHGSWVTQARQP
jgi:transposase-like protein